MSGTLDRITQWSGWGWDGWIALGTLASVAVVVVALGVALGWIRPRAKLDVFIDPGPPGKIRIKTFGGQGAWAGYYCRLRVENYGMAVAEGVEVQMLELRKRDASDAMVVDPVFLPLDLKWSFDQEQGPRLLPGVRRFCDLVHVDDPAATEGKPWLVFHSSMYPAEPNELRVGEWPTRKPPGNYELDVGVAGVNAKTVRRTISIRFTDQWYDDEVEMFSKGLVVHRK